MSDSIPTLTKYVAYYRVSTDKQGRSGLGLEAQTAAIETFTRPTAGEIIATFQEIESGRRNDRPELLKALALCRQKKAVLVIAKLDRLSRNLAFIANLMESRVEFVACDMPEANQLTLHIMAAMAQHEREATSKRTKEAMAAAKARGQKLGSPKPGSKQARPPGRRRHSSSAMVFILSRASFKERGLTLRQIAQELNERHIRTCNNRAWYPQTVNRLLKQATCR